MEAEIKATVDHLNLIIMVSTDRNFTSWMHFAKDVDGLETVSAEVIHIVLEREHYSIVELKADAWKTWEVANTAMKNQTCMDWFENNISFPQTAMSEGTSHQSDEGTVDVQNRQNKKCQ